MKIHYRVVKFDQNKYDYTLNCHDSHSNFYNIKNTYIQQPFEFRVKSSNSVLTHLNFNIPQKKKIATYNSLLIRDMI